MTSLVTGAAGFVGSAVVRELLRHGHRVKAMVRKGSVRRNLEGLAIETVEGDLTDRLSLDRALAGCEALFHVAADYRLWVPDPGPMYRTNVEGTRHIMEAARDAGISRIVYTSSVATLGLDPQGAPAAESMPVCLDDMIGHYKKSKFLAEQLVRMMARDQALPVVIVNPSTPVGCGDLRPTPTGRMIRQAALGRMPAYVNTGLNIVHVDDVAVGHRLAFERGALGERYILGSENLSLREILHAIAELSGRAPPRFSVPHGAAMTVACLAEAWARWTRAGEPLATVDGVRLSRKKMFFSHAKATEELGYSPRPAREALRDAVQWFLEQSGLLPSASETV